MSTVLTTHPSPAPDSVAASTTPRTARQHGEFIMAGSLTSTGDPETGTLSSPVTVMPDYAHREEVHIMLKKLRDGVALWKRIPNPPPPSARDSIDRFLLPQHTMHIK
ncbi:hypothetical protein [Arthrobacter sp. CAN_A1]|uniref:hypothetical protein n=1 Tax=Arthrobacter sp. CAN_A1 TaxID=2787717 RepID=UPI0018C984A0